MTQSVRRPLWVVGAALSIGAGVIHFALGPEHVEELGPLGYGFFVSGALQLWWAALAGIAVARWGSSTSGIVLRRIAVVGIAINVAILAAWAVSRTVGLPAGETPWTPEPIGAADAICGLFEGLLVVGLAMSLRGRRFAARTAPRAVGFAAAALTIALIGAGTALAVASPESAHVHAAGVHDHAASAMEPSH